MLQARLSGMPTDSEAAVLAAAAALQARGVDHILVKLGADGSLMVPPAPAAPVRQRAIRAEKVRVVPRSMQNLRLRTAVQTHSPIARLWTPRARAIASPRPLAWR